MIRAIVTDIEGTTSSLSFVKDILFPYAHARIGNYVRCHAEEDQIAPLLDDVRMEAGESLDLEGVIAQLEQWIDEDRKVTPLKALQGMLWAEGYRQGDFTGHVYPDAIKQLKQWHSQGIKLYVYSSGSVYAQKLLFGHTHSGDLNPLFSGYFDTRIGAKGDINSYEKIATEIGCDAADILFLSDIEAELDAARAAGMHTIWLVRDHEPDPGASHTQVRDFSAITINV